MTAGRRALCGARRFHVWQTGQLVDDFVTPRDKKTQSNEEQAYGSVRRQPLRQPHQVHRLHPVAIGIIAPCGARQRNGIIPAPVAKIGSTPAKAARSPLWQRQSGFPWSLASRPVIGVSIRVEVSAPGAFQRRRRKPSSPGSPSAVAP